MGYYATPIKRKDNWTKYLLIHMNWNITDRELKTLIKKNNTFWSLALMLLVREQSWTHKAKGNRMLSNLLKWNKRWLIASVYITATLSFFF